MKNRNFLLFGLFSFALLILAIFSSMTALSSTPPAIITYQGKLLFNNSPATTTVGMKFVIYDSLTGGHELYTASGTPNVMSSTVAITPVSGLFSINLGDTTGDPVTEALDPAIFQNNNALYLEVEIDGEKMSPRKLITAAPYALNSKYLDGHIATSTPTTTAYVPVSDSDGNFNFSGVTSTNLTVIGNSAMATTSVSALTIGGQTFSDLLGSGLAVSSGVLTLGASYLDGSAYDTRFVNVSGDTMTGDLSFGGVYRVRGLAEPMSSDDAATKSYVDNLVNGLDWVPSVIARTSTVPGANNSGDRYIVIAPASGDFSGYENYIAEYNGATWDFTAPATNTTAFVVSEGYSYTYNGSAWVTVSTGMAESDPVWMAASSSYLTQIDAAATYLTQSNAALTYSALGHAHNLSALTNDVGFVTSSGARAAISETIAGISYDNSTGVFSLTGGYQIPTTASVANWDIIYNTVTSSYINWDTAYGWGNHASAGYITDGNTGWDNIYGFITSGGGMASGTTAGEFAYWNGASWGAAPSTTILLNTTTGYFVINGTVSSTRGIFGNATTTGAQYIGGALTVGGVSSLSTTTITSSTIATANITNGNISVLNFTNATSTGNIYIGGVASIIGTSTLATVLPNMTGGTGNMSIYNLGASASRWSNIWAQYYNVGTSTYSIAADNGKFGIFDTASAGGNNRLTIDSAGRLGVGTTTPSYLVDISASSTANPLRIGSTATSSMLTVSRSGFVGIGTSSPEFALDLTGDGGIISRGASYGSNNSAVLATTGAGTRFIWYPRKAAFRVGAVDADQWDNSNIGDLTSAFGYSNKAIGMISTIGGGFYNTIWSSGFGSFIGGGYMNFATGSYSFIGSGENNSVIGNVAFVGGGSSNSASGDNSFVGGGSSNIASGFGSFAFGNNMTVSGYSSFGINLDQYHIATLSRTSTMAIMGGGVGVGTTSPKSLLTVYGDVFLEGGNRYINFGSVTTGTSGYGIYDQNGSLKFKNSNGSWKSMAGVTTTAVSSGQVAFWDGVDSVLAGDSNLFWDNSNYRLGIGTTTPSSKLTLVGGNFTHKVSSWPLSLSSVYDTPGTATDVAIDGGFAYVADGVAGLEIYDISSPTSPVLIGNYDSPGNAEDVFVVGKYAYLLDMFDGLSIIDISNPSVPSLVSTYDQSTAVHDLYVSGKYLYLTSSDGLRILDISNPAAPILIGFYHVASDQPTGVFISGKYAYVNQYNNTNVRQLNIINVSNPAAPTLVGSSVFPGDYSQGRIYVIGEKAYVSAGSFGTAIFNISNPSSPSLLGTIGGSNDVVVAGKYAYTAAGSGVNMKVYDISSSTASALITSYTYFPNDGIEALGIAISGKYAYLALGTAGLAVVDINGIESPSASIGSISTDDLKVSVNLHVANSGYFGNGLNVGVGGVLTNGSVYSLATSSYSYFACGLGIGTSTPTYLLEIISSSSTQNILRVGTSTNNNLLIVNSTGRVGIGTSTPEFKLDISGDGGIIARGTYGVGEVLSTAGSGTRMIWYPRKGAFRVGMVTNDEWNDTKIGVGSTVSGGESNTASGTYSGVGSGQRNASKDFYSFIGGGLDNSVELSRSFIGGGELNTVNGAYALVGGGKNNTAYSGYTAVVGGLNNYASGLYSFVGGGFSNTTTGQGSVALGHGMSVSGTYSFGIGIGGATATYLITQNNTMAIMGGSVGIGTVAPTSTLSVLSTSTSGGLFQVGTTTAQNILYVGANGNVGVGTSTPEFKLDISGDGGIIARGTYGSGATLSSSASGTASMIWYPRRGAFRVGGVTGAQWNDANIGNYSAVVGGTNNVAYGAMSFVGGGYSNTSSIAGSFIGGGHNNDVAATNSFVAAGYENKIFSGAYESFIGSGYNNQILGTAMNAFIAGGDSNINSGYGSFIGGGGSNFVSGTVSFIAGGSGNSISGSHSFTAAGDFNNISGEFSVAFGHGWTMSSSYGFGINLSSFGSDYTLSQTSTMAVMGGNVGIGTTTPAYLLDVSASSTASPLRVGSTATSSMLVINQYGLVGINNANPSTVTSSYNTILDMIGGVLMRSNSTTYNTVSLNAGNTTVAGAQNVNRLRFGGNDTNSRDYFTIQGASDVDMLTINGGNVGIGTTTPGYKLTVAGSVYVTGNGNFATSTFSSSSIITANIGTANIDNANLNSITILGTSTLYNVLPNMTGPLSANVSQYNLGASTSRWSNLWAQYINVGTSTFSLNGDDGNFAITDRAGGAGSNRLAITSAGNVGIGTSSPVAKFTMVGGSFLATGAMGDPTSPPVSGAGTRMMWVPGANVFRVGVVSGAQWDYLNLGPGSFASGRDTVGFGDYSFAIGQNTDAHGNYSFAGGLSVTSSGDYSMVYGSNGSVVSGNYSLGFGYNVDVSGKHSLVFGNNIQSSGEYSLLFGRDSTSTGSVISLGKLNHVDGASLLGWHGIAIGDNNEVHGNLSSAAIGWENSVFGEKSMAFGSGSTVSGDYSVAFNLSSTPGIDNFVDNSFLIQNGDLSIVNGQVCVGMLACGYSSGKPLQVNGNSYFNGDGYFTGEVSAQTVVDRSDIGFKTNVKNLDDNYGVKLIMELQPVSYDLISNGIRQIGFIAQDVRKYLPEVVSGTELSSGGAGLGMQYGKMVAIVVKAIQEQQSRIDLLTSTTIALSTSGNITQQINYSSGSGGSLLSVKSIKSADDKWEIDEDGRFITRLDTSEGKKDMYAMQSPQAEFVFSSSSQLIGGEMRVDFDTSTREIIDGESQLKVSVTLTSGEGNGIFVKAKDALGFVVKELGGGSSNASFDWVVVAKRKSGAINDGSTNDSDSALILDPVISPEASDLVLSTQDTNVTTTTVQDNTTSSTLENDQLVMPPLPVENPAPAEPLPETTGEPVSELVQ